MTVDEQSARLILIYLVYGVAFYSLGLFTAAELKRSTSDLPFAKAMMPLAAFGILHGLHEWLEMYMREIAEFGIDTVPIGLEVIRVTLLAVSFCSLLAFGVRLLYPEEHVLQADYYIAGGMFAFWVSSVLVMGLVIEPGNAMHLSVRSWLQMADTWSRYSLAMPGGLLAAYALYKQARSLPEHQVRYVRRLYVASATFVIYGIFGQLFVGQSYLFPSMIINAEVFEAIFGVPVQLFRASIAVVFAITLIPVLNMFEMDRRRDLAAAEERARSELARREVMRREMLQHTVAAQEEERRRIARELHDQIGQTLTALSLGLESLLQASQNGQSPISDSIEGLRNMTSDAVADLHHLVADLRPSQLDHLGLAAALRSLTEEYRKRFGLKISLNLSGRRRRLPPEVELAVFRIAQEGVTNVARHAGVTKARINVEFQSDHVLLTVIDTGVGFEFDRAFMEDERHGQWGLLGMAERAAQLDGTFDIETSPGKGTRVTATLPLEARMMAND